MDSARAIILSRLADLLKVVGTKRQLSKVLGAQEVSMGRWFRIKGILPGPAMRQRIDNLHLELCGMDSKDIRRGRQRFRRFRPNLLDGFIDGDGI
jgi:hypothetical protein